MQLQLMDVSLCFTQLRRCSITKAVRFNFNPIRFCHILFLYCTNTLILLFLIFCYVNQYKDTGEAAVAGVKIIAESCIKSKSVKKLIYTASAMAASPLKGAASGYKDVMDETCWSPLDLPYEMYFVSTKSRCYRVLFMSHLKNTLIQKFTNIPFYPQMCCLESKFKILCT